MAQVWLTMCPLDPQTHVTIIPLVSKCIMRMDILGIWHETHIGFLACDTRGTHSGEGQMEASCVSWVYGSPHRRITMKTSRVLQQGHAIYGGELYTFQKIVPGMLLGPGRDKCLTIGHQVAMQPELLYMSWEFYL